MHVELREGNVDDLVPEWAELYRADDRSTPFQSPAWVCAWWRHWAGRARPWVLTVRQEARLVGLLALCGESVAGLTVIRTNGDPGDYCDLLALPELRASVEAVIGAELRARAREWDVLILGQLPPGSTTAAAVERAGVRASHRAAIACPGIALPDTFDAYLSSLPKTRRGNLRRHLRRLDDGELEIREPRLEGLSAGLERWQAMRVREWEALGKHMNPVHATTRFRRLLLDALTGLMPDGLAQFWEFHRHGRLVGSFVNFCDRRTFYHYLGAFEPEVRSLGIGKAATGEAIRRSIDEGRSYYDFTRGSEPYKYWYGAADRDSGTVVLRGARRRSLVVTPACLLATQLPGVKRWPWAKRAAHRIHDAPDVPRAERFVHPMP
ncbi:MAG TPA: GNAT family N-acetyltransferase [Thermoleophilaceae bacterium]|jgi:CelD/BcsL family acetyltransferase involved in cellulose biosynthesis|nr:GNAT family N-acetyltransferase [Thermoleophilaceae bacterium]